MLVGGYLMVVILAVAEEGPFVSGDEPAVGAFTSAVIS
jgi:hypothetical protein